MVKKTAERNIKLQSYINFLTGFVFLVPIINLFYRYTGLSIAEIILISNASTITVCLFELPTSVWADTVGRKKALVVSVICNLIASVFILFFPSLIGFIIASIFAGLYFSFWSGTGQAFLEDNLRILGKEKEFGKRIGHLMSLETLAEILTPLIASLILKIFNDSGYVILAYLDVFSAILLIILTVKLKDQESPNKILKKVESFKTALSKNLKTAKTAFKNIIKNKNLRTLLVYRSLANHVAFLYIVSLPLSVENGMAPWMAGVFGTVGMTAMMLANKYVYKIGEKYSYNFAWIVSTIGQAVLLIIAGIFIKSWIALTIVMIFFNLFEGLWQPAWNHVFVEQTKGIAIATTRSVILTVFALYTTVGKQILSIFPVGTSLIAIGIFILLVNIILGKKVLKMGEEFKKEATPIQEVQA